jgi:DNA adenine methylase
MTPSIKSQGIKTKLIPWIADAIPSDFSGRWIEPFMGTGIVGLNLATENAILSDINPHLVNFYNALSLGIITPAIVKEHLEQEGESLLSTGEAHYYYVRDRFNETGDPLDFLFVNRAGFNGMIRFNRKGGFNIPFCRKPNRFAQAYVTKITNQTKWVQAIIKNKNFKFICQDFKAAISAAQEGDLIYCDPPYIGRHVDYFSGWNEEAEFELAESLSASPAQFILSSWHHNDFRKNEYMETLWSKFHISTQEHFYHVGGKEANRNPVVEALVTNYPYIKTPRLETVKQLELEVI